MRNEKSAMTASSDLALAPLPTCVEPRPYGPLDSGKTGSQSPLWRKGNAMFEETIRALRKLDGTTSIPVSISSDQKGCFDRECPSEECQFQFTVLMESWKAKVRDEEIFCPFCGHTADATEWNTEEQIEHLKQAAIAHLRSTMGTALRRDADCWNRRQPRNSSISMTMKVDSRPQQVALPPAAAEPMRLKIVCPACECRYAVIGAAYFCPSCGHNAADQVFAQTIAGIRQSLASCHHWIAG